MLGSAGQQDTGDLFADAEDVYIDEVTIGHRWWCPDMSRLTA